MDFLLYKLIVIASFQFHALSKCTGKNGPDCCFGFSWDSLSQSCKPCKPGYDGINCSQTCRYPSFGLECQGECQCPPEFCDFSFGCVITSPKAEYTEGTTDLPEMHKMTTETESKQALYGLNKQWLTAIIGLLLIIVFSIIIYLCGQKFKRKFSQQGKSGKSLQKMKQSSADSYTPLREQGYRQEILELNPNQENTKAIPIYEEIDADHLEHPIMEDTTKNMKINNTSLADGIVYNLSQTEDISYLELIDSEGCSTSYENGETQENCEDAINRRQDRESGTIDIEMCQKHEDKNSYLTAI